MYIHLLQSLVYWKVMYRHKTNVLFVCYVGLYVLEQFSCTHLLFVWPLNGRYKVLNVYIYPSKSSKSSLKYINKCTTISIIMLDVGISHVSIRITIFSKQLLELLYLTRFISLESKWVWVLYKKYILRLNNMFLRAKHI